eukprot:CAMPEP_0168527766 /NCGR_PEP_ID=MMETSP0405-20121227/12820_1 /TAXON_ID=498012 /ORGANISM="Trichosphaerium sp, Strain Am-I-7 wt" /LENGTH=43 /DNA_ID= /DNA_START= /DNA_END= /DNA_ORIENTATION=
MAKKNEKKQQTCELRNTFGHMVWNTENGSVGMTMANCWGSAIM